ncbi:hypothetical protein SAMN02910265_02987 [Ruminococcus flavefaciens]|uniref:Uncharacterized protein n=1 Tax=Ruminococcus flavefaciens TaxID=1265 RepID=A0A1H6L6G8_RUMFL|nr:hypothetical protein [Ruminococcus flavefaciens]SEH84083.1 hypothetical protein SAMN02910265_02987 [Ruminococcus flavefaciens]
MKGIVILLVICAVVACCFTHRRVIRALIKHEPMPPAPKWHFWCQNKRS